MKQQYHSEFTLSLLILLTRMAARGDYPGMRELGIRHDQIDKLQGLSTHQIQQMAMISKARFVDIKVDADALDTVIEISRQRAEQHSVAIALLKAGATNPIMQQLFGMTPADIAELRRFLVLPKVEGRPVKHAEHEENELWLAWQDIKRKPMDLPQQLLSLHEMTGVKIYAIWPFLQKWAFNEDQRCA